MKTLYFVTGNKGKLVEVQNKFSKVDVKVVQMDLGYPEIQADSLEDVAMYGLNDVRKRFDKPFILEDAGLFIDGLNGFPGVYSSFVYYTVGCEGIIRLMEDFEENSERKAVFRSVFAFSMPNEKPVLFVGECPGFISKELRGSYGFGYDPIFIPDGEHRTFAEMSVEEKNCFSHRGRSLDKLIDFFKNK